MVFFLYFWIQVHYVYVINNVHGLFYIVNDMLFLRYNLKQKHFLFLYILLNILH